MKSSMKANPQQKYGVSVCHQMLCRSCLSLLLQLQMPGKMQYIMCNVDTLLLVQYRIMRVYPVRLTNKTSNLIFLHFEGKSNVMHGKHSQSTECCFLQLKIFLS